MFDNGTRLYVEMADSRSIDSTKVPRSELPKWMREEQAQASKISEPKIKEEDGADKLEEPPLEGEEEAPAEEKE